MPETFLILLSGGVMVAALISSPRRVSVHWLRLCGILALCFAGLGIFFVIRRPLPVGVGLILLIASILGQLALVQTLFLGGARLAAGVAFAAAVFAGCRLIGSGVTPQSALACLGASALPGLALMDMLLGHAYLTAAKMTISPFRRLNLALAIALILCALSSIVAILLQHQSPIELFWPRFGLLVGTRWLIGLIVPAILVYMAHDCIKRRSTQSATGILYVTGVLIFIGTLIGLHLARETGLPL